MFGKARCILLSAAFNGLRNSSTPCHTFPAALAVLLRRPHRLQSIQFMCQLVGNADNRTPNVFEAVDFEAVTNGDAETLKKLKLIMLEMDVMRQEGLTLPSSITTEKWKDLLLLQTRSQRMKLLRFWFINEMKKVKDRQKKEQKRQERLAQLEENASDDGHIKYGFGGSTIFLRIYDTAIDRWMNSRLMEAMMFGQKIVVDCGYEKYMTLKEVSNCALQLCYVFAENRSHKSPFDVYFCNANQNGPLMSKMHKMIPTMYNDDFPINFSEKSYLDLFPKEKLVYLTPHCRDELVKYNHDDIYIIGAMVDKVNCDPLSLAKAKAEGLRMAQLPLDRHLDWSVGTKSLTINQVMCIMLDMKVTNNWDTALSHVPRRKINQTPEKFKRQKKLISMRELYG